MFSHDIKIGLGTSAFPKKVIQNLQTKELRKNINELVTQEQAQQDSDLKIDNQQKNITGGDNIKIVNNNYQDISNNNIENVNIGMTKYAKYDGLSSSINGQCTFCLYKKYRLKQTRGKKIFRKSSKKIKTL